MPTNRVADLPFALDPLARLEFNDTDPQGSANHCRQSGTEAVQDSPIRACAWRGNLRAPLVADSNGFLRSRIERDVDAWHEPFPSRFSATRTRCSRFSF